MKILLVCAGGMSTGLLMNKMKTYWAQQGKELTINAVGLGEYEDVCKEYDIVMSVPRSATVWLRSRPTPVCPVIPSRPLTTQSQIAPTS